METLIMKFGGASVATPAHFARIADIILEQKRCYPHIVVVVSAMGNTTDQLIELAKQVNPCPPQREYDMLVSVGERISISLLAMALAAKNHEAVSFTGSQSGIITCNRHTEARIIDVQPHRLIPHLEAGRVVIVAGFQGVSRTKEITTLGRGGSDTSAVALGIALKAKLKFFKPVDGIYRDDPKKNPEAELLEKLTYAEALDIIDKGAKVLHRRSLLLACKNALPLEVCSFQDPTGDKIGTLIANPYYISPPAPVYEDC